MLFSVVIYICHKVEKRNEQLESALERVKCENRRLIGENAFLQRRATQFMEEKYKYAKPVSATVEKAQPVQ
jgi:hypothetical protein